LPEFPGADHFVRSVDEAVRCDCAATITEALRTTLVRLMRDPRIRLPECLFEAESDHYARRELYRSPDLGYCVIAMTWGPGQGTPIHDHSGMWCVEGVWHGALEITPYELVESREDRYRFESRGTIHAGAGSAGSLIPPHEYHTIRNPSRDDNSVSLHIYRGPMTCCSVFQAGADGWYHRGRRELSLDRLH
jgi:predicted metal-dependent enzyme (double-stranded beta helix superfamily)